MKKITFIIPGNNPKRNKFKVAMNEALGQKFELKHLETNGPFHAADLGKEAVNAETDYVIAVGGDGMLNEVLNGFMRANKNSGANAILGAFPFGTGNDFAKTTSIPSNLTEWITLLENNSVKPTDIGYMEFNDTNYQKSSRYFMNISDIGIGGYVAKRVNESSKLLGSNLSYMKAIVVSFLTYKHRKVRITGENFSFEGPILLAVMANGKYFGSGLGIAPGAKVDDGEMQLVILANVTLLDYLKHLGVVKRAEPIDHPEVTYVSLKSCEVETLEECTIDMDGEFIGYGPIACKIIPKAVNFLRP